MSSWWVRASWSRPVRTLRHRVSCGRSHDRLGVVRLLELRGAGGDPLRRSAWGNFDGPAGRLHVVLNALQPLLELDQPLAQRAAHLRQLLAEQQDAQDEQDNHLRTAETKHGSTPPR